MRRRRNGSNGVLDPPAATLPPPLVIDPHAVYRPQHVIAALGLRASSLRSEWRAGRLRIVRRCGKNYILGRDLLLWLDDGELPSPATAKQTRPVSPPS